MRIKFLLAVMVGLLFWRSAEARTLEEDLSQLSSKISKVLVVKKMPKVAITDFRDLKGRTTELGKFVAEQFTVEMVNAEGLSVLDRANIKSILDEHHLSEEGLVKPENAKKLGEFSGVDAIIIGTITPLGGELILSVKALSTLTSRVVAAGTIHLQKTRDLEGMMAHVAGSASAASLAGSVASDGEVGTFREIGDLKIVLKKIRTAKVENASRDGFKVELDLENTNTTDPLLIAVAGKESVDGNFYDLKMEDDHEQVWVVDEAKGLAFVASAKSASGSLATAISNGKHGDFEPGASFMRVMYSDGSAGGPAPPSWTGSFVEVPPASSVKAVLLFKNLNGAAALANAVLDLQGELVVGKGDREQPDQCAQYTVVFEGIRVSRKR